MPVTTATRRGYSNHGNRGNRGGISKHNKAVRADRDGDVGMGTSQGSRTQPSRAGRGGIHSRQSPAPRPTQSTRGNNRHVAKKEQLLGALQRGNLRIAGQGRDQKPSGNIRVTGWTKSTASTDSDGGMSALISWLERRVNIAIRKRTTSQKTTPPRSFKLDSNKYHVKGDVLMISAHGTDASDLLHLDGFVFAGINIKVEEVDEKREKPDPASEETSNVRSMLQDFLSRRYDPNLKLLNLSEIGQDQELRDKHMFETASATMKFIPALMKICDEIFQSADQKKEAVKSISLASNDLDSLNMVQGLAPTFPDLLNLDLSNNKLPNLASILPWKKKFQLLEQLILRGNPLEQESPGYAEQLTTWFPNLRILNNIQIRTDEQIARQQQVAPPVLGPNFQDESGVGAHFIKSFFLAFDTNRQALAHEFYDENSSFSLTVNASAPREAGQQSFFKRQDWDPYMKASRNLKKVSHLNTRMGRQFTGPTDILNCWQSLPVTQHPDLESQQDRWLLECQILPGIPDPSGNIATGVDGLIITAHGEYDEPCVSAGGAKITRSFDRTFVLGPGGPSGVRVVSDMLTVRAYGGYAGYKPANALEPAQQTNNTSAAPPLTLPTLNEEQSAMLAELARQTGMNLKYSQDCLEQSQWNFLAAMESFKAVQPNLGPEAFA
ncbi:MAG: nuclear mRNA export, poly(A)+RNA binding protein [Bogoriella megaspora]|nr:MAG: nuclear mRNA export, poly(A)+RNA binding protein [Bogoriella megaspora]